MYTTLCISSLLRNETFCCCSTLWFSCLKLWFCIFSDQVYPTNYCAQMRPFYLIEAIQTNRMELNEQGEIFAVECIWTKLSSSILDAYLMQSTSISHFSLHAFFWKKKKNFSLSYSHRSFSLWNDFHQFFQSTTVWSQFKVIATRMKKRNITVLLHAIFTQIGHSQWDMFIHNMNKSTSFIASREQQQQ